MNNQKTRCFIITDFGAIGNGRAVSTEAIQKTIDHAVSYGGGTVVVPEGVFTTGALFLKPGVSLHLEKQGELRGSSFIEDYPRTLTRIEGRFIEWRPALINASGCDGLHITGEGLLDGSGPAFWQKFWRSHAADNKTRNIDVERPRLILIDRSNDVVISGVRLKDAGFWNLHLYRCRNVLVEDVAISSPVGAPSTDGIDVDSCRDVTIRRCSISVDDDCIAIKGSKGPAALQDQDSPPVENIRIEECTFGLGHGVVTLGSEATIVRNVSVENCVVRNRTALRCNNVVRLKLRPDTPQIYEDIHCRNIRLEGNARLIAIKPWMQYFDLEGQVPPTSRVQNISIAQVSGSCTSLGAIQGHERSSINNIRLEDINLTVQDETFELGEVRDLACQNMIINGTRWKTPTSASE